MNILVTGGLGFIGHHVVKSLQKNNCNTIIVDNKTTYGVLSKTKLEKLIDYRLDTLSNKEFYFVDIYNKYALDKLLFDKKIDIVIHFASFPRQKVVESNVSWAAKTMTEGLLNLLEVSKNNKIKKFVYISSSMVYGDFTDNVKETHVCNPTNLYGILKLTGENIVKNYAQTYSFDYTIIRPSAVYGPLDSYERLISKFFIQAYNDQVLQVNGIHEKLDFTFVSDLSEGIVSAALSDKTTNKVYNLTKGDSHTIYYIAELIINIVGKGEIVICQKDLNYPSRGALNINAAKGDFNYNPKVNILEGLNKYYEWFRDNAFWLV